MSSLLEVLALSASWLAASLAGYLGARAELALRHAPEHPQLPTVLRTARVAWWAALAVWVASAVLVALA